MLGTAEILTMFGVIFGSQGFWILIQRLTDKRSGGARLIQGLAHEALVSKGMTFIDRGYITRDEFEDYVKYLYEPYSKLGGNGLVEKIYNEIMRLPIKSKLSTRDLKVIMEERKNEDK